MGKGTDQCTRLNFFPLGGVADLIGELGTDNGSVCTFSFFEENYRHRHMSLLPWGKSVSLQLIGIIEESVDLR